MRSILLLLATLVCLLSLVSGSGPLGRARAPSRVPRLGRRVPPHSAADRLAFCTIQQDFSLEGIWVKHDRAVPEIFHLNLTCASPGGCGVSSCMASELPSYSATYMDGPLAGHATFNITMVGDLMSGTGFYNNFADESGSVTCPAPFGLVFEDDTNVVLVSYGATFGTKCGDYTGDSARYYRQSALE